MIFSRPIKLGEALVKALARRLLPSALSSRQQRDVFPPAVRAAAVFSARTTSAAYLDDLSEAVGRSITGGQDNDWAQIKLDLIEKLQRLGYSPATGFGGVVPDAAQGVPPAAPGSLRDLGSDRRIDLILKTQTSLVAGLGQKLGGEKDVENFPAWELVRLSTRNVPRDWVARWEHVGGTLSDGRIVAAKGSELWSRLGSEFPDSLDVDHPPFAFNSGMGWLPVSRMEAQRLGVTDAPQPADPVKTLGRGLQSKAPVIKASPALAAEVKGAGARLEDFFKTLETETSAAAAVRHGIQ